MTTHYEVRYALGKNEVKAMDTEQLRSAFLAEQLMVEGEVNWVYSHYERFMVGGAVPGKTPLALEAIDPLKAPFFLYRRELGIINVGGPGRVVADGSAFELDFKEALYLGTGNEAVRFESIDSQNPARFYLNAAPAHARYPNKKVGKSDAKVLHLGSSETANERYINQLLINGVVETCQLQMGLTELVSGSVWNTMPAHQHDRRNEVYFYFGLPQGQGVCHFMGEPTETRHIWVKNEQAVISPPWSIHCGAGTQSYSFIWGMAGENLNYDDMDKFPADVLR
ncbi:5-dehydro-4-deoxy-D-glucuronate isomerase [Gallaecimonas pentaromativorans]|uniref:4-deoxy-L-threo-5-hexosulose-uronate ketol-isomerase n=1 Tax=Gallaecimonas pentaromativorans TaxID=584787 RepID=A0A3N1PGJ2_9GAMM|nr:5-dehydro-4-deoxy-D-glucuronate isomerase [Gallaecimonas pentaromativorans]ROQ25990.1 4-deoxy-L-threo-5-hexosulose-uronate ketol-isomerase [Gallaecimonas pentaromativorans]